MLDGHASQTDNTAHATPCDSAPIVSRFRSGDDAWMDALREAVAIVPLGVIGDYEVIEQVSRGGQGVVYRARRAHDGLVVAIKRLHGSSLQTRAAMLRFEREIHALSLLSHPAIVRVIEVLNIGGQRAIVMDWIDGVPLTAHMRSAAPRDIAARVALMIAVCDAVQHAHQRGVIHRDLSPANILIDPAGAPHILDFGLARCDAAAANNESHLTRASGFVGTLAYASPEQAGGPGAVVDARTDVYSIGVLLFELLTGTLPYSVDGGLLHALQAITQERPVRPSTRILAQAGLALNARPPDSAARRHGANAPPRLTAARWRELDAIVLKTLAKDPSERYQSVDAVRDDLRRWERGEPVHAHAPTRLYLLRKLARRYPATTGLAFGLMVLAISSAIGMSVLAGRLARESRVSLAARAQETRQREIAERVSAFLSDTLSSAAPSRAGADASALELLEAAERRIPLELVAEPEAAAEAYFAVGRTYRALWKAARAVPPLRAALAGRISRFGEQHEETAACMWELGKALANCSDREAVAMQTRCLAIRRGLHGDEHELTAAARLQLAYALFRTKPRDFDAAERLMLESIDTYRRRLGPLHRDIASALHNFGYMRLVQTRAADARILYEQALTMLRELGDVRDPYYVECLFGYASVLSTLREHDLCLAALAEAIPLTRDVYGDAWTHDLWRQQGAVLRRVGKTREARDSLAAAVTVKCAELSRKHQVHAGPLTDISRHVNDAAQSGSLCGIVPTLAARLRVLPPELRVPLVEALRHFATCWMGADDDGGEELLRMELNAIGASSN